MVVRAEPAHVEIDPNRELELFTAVDIMEVICDITRSGREGEKAVKMTNIEQVLPKYV